MTQLDYYTNEKERGLPKARQRQLPTNSRLTRPPPIPMFVSFSHLSQAGQSYLQVEMMLEKIGSLSPATRSLHINVPPKKD